jgi:hypothetical protein
MAAKSPGSSTARRRDKCADKRLPDHATIPAENARSRVLHHRRAGVARVRNIVHRGAQSRAQIDVDQSVRRRTGCDPPVDLQNVRGAGIAISDKLDAEPGV